MIAAASPRLFPWTEATTMIVQEAICLCCIFYSPIWCAVNAKGTTVIIWWRGVKIQWTLCGHFTSIAYSVLVNLCKQNPSPQSMGKKVGLTAQNRFSSSKSNLPLYFPLPEELLHCQLGPINDISVVSCQQCFQGAGSAVWSNFMRSAVEYTYQAWRHL